MIKTAQNDPTLVRSSRPITTQRRGSLLFVWSALIVCGALLAWLSSLRYTGYNAGMLDLGNMSQAIGSVQRGEPLIFTYKQGPTSRLAFHVELFYLLLGLVYWLWSDPRLLVIIQAGLFALGALPVYRIALRRSHSGFVAGCFALIYLLYPVAQTAVLFDMHGDTLAMPLLLFALDALDRRSWRWYGLWVVLALSCKFYVAVPVAVLGLVVWWQMGDRRAGLLTTAGALLYGALAFLVIRPWFTTAATSQQHRGLNYLQYYFGELSILLTTWDQRLLTAIVVFGPLCLLLWRGWRWLLPGLPLAGVVLVSTNGSSFDFRFHHYALVVPFLLMAAIHGLPATRPTRTGPRRPFRSFPPEFIAVLTLLLVVLFNSTFVNTPLSMGFWAGMPGWGMDQSSYGVTARDGIKDHFLATHVPPQVPVAASTFLAAHITERDVLYSVRYPDDPGGVEFPTYLPQVDYVVADALFDFRLLTGDDVPVSANYEITEIRQVMNDPAFGLTAATDGLLLFRRNAPASEVLTQEIEVVTNTTGAAPAAITLAEARIEPLGGRRYRATFEWIAPAADALRGPLMAVSRLDGVPQARIVHLPTYALAPPTSWQPGQHIRETFDVELPPDVAPGTYTWQVGWYDLRHSESYLTDARSQVGQENTVARITVP